MNETNNLRVFVDTNILISAVLSAESISSELLTVLIEDHQLVISSHSITEASKVINRKFPGYIGKWDHFLTSLEFELTYTPTDLTTVKAPYIRDDADLPILVSAVIAQPDILITGDRDFHTSEIREYFAVYTPAEFLRYFGYLK